ncbi:hypothetical protein EKO04_007965 [Ascochyta lentis]|uniref:FAD linked oxidase N-terminal domain-containing protein n=1 Tax=Ascochyta lentis TaxID=205686 RepID=A0A8H7MF59_9PLEO|nr:hypothetical protein EKO04_007965 [Ascochyta lentis]
MANQKYFRKDPRTTAPLQVDTGRPNRELYNLAASSSLPNPWKYPLLCSCHLANCPFSDKGGGHAAFRGASNIDGGITVSMENMKQVSASADKKTVDIGPGNRWVNVYTALKPYGIGVAGSRMATVGVPGLLLGGGITFFSNKIGWTCDNVASYEVVTASGIIINATPDKQDVGRPAYIHGELDYTQPVGNASMFNDWNAIHHLQSTTDIHTLAELTIMMNQGLTDGLRQTQWDVSFKVDRNLFNFFVTTFYLELPAVQDAVSFFPSTSIQAKTAGQLKGMQKNGNALCLNLSNGPYFIMNMSSRWVNASDDARILAFFSTVVTKVKAEAQDKGLDNDYIYMNYASQFQDPIASYRAANVKELQANSAKYDPASIFLNPMPGQFKLGKGAPSPNMP